MYKDAFVHFTSKCQAPYYSNFSRWKDEKDARENAREFKIIKWPTKEEAKKAFAIVAAFTIAYIILVGVFDFAFQKLFEFILSFR